MVRTVQDLALAELLLPSVRMTAAQTWEQSEAVRSSREIGYHPLYYLEGAYTATRAESGPVEG